MSELAAKRWANALVELAQEDNTVTKESVAEDLREAAQIFNTSEELTEAINNPSIAVEEKQIVLCKLFQDKLSPIVYNFLFVLNLRKRLSILNEILDEYEKELENLNNIVRVEVTSAIDINDAKKEEIKSKIAEKLKKEVNISWEVNSDVIAGLVFNINDTVIDNSIKHKLDKLSNVIIRG